MCPRKCEVTDMKTRSLRRKRLFGNLLTYCIVAAAFVILQLLNAGGMLSPSLQGQLVPICAYVTMAVALNLVVGISGELSLGHAGFMSVGAFSGVVASISLQELIPMGPLRLLVSMLIGAFFAGIAGVIDDDEIRPVYIIPGAFDTRVASAVAKAVRKFAGQ